MENKGGMLEGVYLAIRGMNIAITFLFWKIKLLVFIKEVSITITFSFWILVFENVKF